MDVCSNPLSFSLFSLLLHAPTILHTLSLERPFPNRVKRDPARHTCEVSLPPPGVGLDLKPDFPGQILPCQFYLFFVYLFFPILYQHDVGQVSNVGASQRLNMKIKGKLMPVLLGCSEQ